MTSENESLGFYLDKNNNKFEVIKYIDKPEPLQNKRVKLLPISRFETSCGQRLKEIDDNNFTFLITGDLLTALPYGN